MNHVLLVEPDKPLAKTYANALTKAGYVVQVATNSQEAINKADSVLPNAVILELQLVGHSGIEFLYEFRSYADWQGVPVLIHTNVPYMELENSWSLLTSHLGVSGYRYKPDTNLKTLIVDLSKLTK